MGGEPVPRVQGLGAEASAQRGIFRKDAPSNHDAGSGAHAHRKETMMRFYTEQHRFYSGVDLHARTVRLTPLRAVTRLQNFAGAVSAKEVNSDLRATWKEKRLPKSAGGY
jgi:hypothetical protein